MVKNNASHTVRRGLAASAAAAICVVGLFAGTSAANADSIDSASKGSITLHKFENPGGGAQTPDGTGQNPSSKPIDDVVFEYCSIDGVDLLNGANTGWDKLTAVTTQQLVAARTGAALGSLSLSNCQQLDPTVGGITTTGTIDLGAYLVREIKAPAKVTKLSDPFIVTVPTPSVNAGEGDGEWVYDVNVYPKNDVGDGPFKTIQNQPQNGYVLGSDVSYSISQKAPAVTGDVYTKFVVSDTLDPRLVGSKAPVVSVNGTVLSAGTDYEASWATAGTPAQSTLTVTLTGALAGMKIGDLVQVDFVATLSALGNGEISNEALVNVNDLDLDGDDKPGTPTNTVWTRWGEIKMQKVDAGAPAKGLDGAEFEVFMSDKASGCRLDDNLVQVKDAAGENLVAASGADGTISIPGLWIGDDERDVDNIMVNGLTERCYVLVEVKAPNGFVLPAGDAAKTEAIVKAGSVTSFSKTITNRQQGVPELPLTGAAGQIIMVTGGLALLAVSVGSVLVTRRRKRAEA